MDILDALINFVHGNLPKVVEFCNQHPYRAFAAAVLFLLLVTHFVVHTCIEFCDWSKHLHRTRLGLYSMVAVLLAQVSLAGYFVHSFAPQFGAPKFALERSEFVGQNFMIKWTDDNKASSGHYLLESSPNANFKPATAYHPSAKSWRYKNPVDGERWWRVKAVDSNQTVDGKDNFLVRWWNKFFQVEVWSEPVRTVYYSNSLARIKATGRVIIGISRSDDPTAYFQFSHHGKTAGYEIDLVKQVIKGLEKKLGRPIELDLRAQSWPLLDKLANGDADMVISMTSVRSRREAEHKIIFTEPYYCTTLSVLYRPGANLDASKNFLNGKVGVEARTTSEELIKALAKTNIGVNIVSTENMDEVLNKLINGEINAVIVDTPIAEDVVEQNAHSSVKLLAHRLDVAALAATLLEKSGLPPERVEEMKAEKYAIAVREEDKELRTFINDVLGTMKGAKVAGVADMKFKSLKELLNDAIKAYDDSKRDTTQEPAAINQSMSDLASLSSAKERVLPVAEDDKNNPAAAQADPRSATFDPLQLCPPPKPN